VLEKPTRTIFEDPMPTIEEEMDLLVKGL
jgi:hypothetical protein